jgi:acyl-CoA synthetase (AMP-forming)/AMP-acid ligase II
MATDDRQQTERRFVRSEDPNLSAEANAALTEELQQAIGAEQVSMPADAPDPAAAERSGDSSAAAMVASMRPLFIVTLLAALTVGAVIALSTGSWWALVVAVGVHAAGTMVVASGAIQLTTQIEHASPQTTARLEEEGVADPDRVLSDLVEEFTGEAESSPAAGVISAGDSGSRAPAAQRRAMTPGVPASGDHSVVAALPWFVVTGVTLVALMGAVLEGGKVWATPAIVLPLGAAWIALDRYFSSRTEQERSPGPGRLVIVGACVVAGVIVFVSLMRLAVQ